MGRASQENANAVKEFKEAVVANKFTYEQLVTMLTVGSVVATKYEVTCMLASVDMDLYDLS